MIPSRRFGSTRISSIAAACAVAVALAAALPACGSSSPTAPGSNASSVQVTANGGSVSGVSPGESRQLTATATNSNGTTTDVTTQATRQSSAETVATISSTGLLTAASEGSADINATYQSVRGTLRVTESEPASIFRRA
jgi:hypothetical protein